MATMTARGPDGLPHSVQCDLTGVLYTRVVGGPALEHQGETYGFSAPMSAPATTPCSTSDEPAITISYGAFAPSGGAVPRSRHLYRNIMEFCARPCQLHHIDLQSLSSETVVVKLYDNVPPPEQSTDRPHRESLRRSLKRAFHQRKSSVAPLEGIDEAIAAMEETEAAMRSAEKQEKAHVKASSGDITHSVYSFMLKPEENRVVSFPAGLSFKFGIMASASGVEFDVDEAGAPLEGNALMTVSMTL